MQVFVKNVDGNSKDHHSSLDVEPNDTIQNMKAKIQDKASLPNKSGAFVLFPCFRWAQAHFRWQTRGGWKDGVGPEHAAGNPHSRGNRADFRQDGDRKDDHAGRGTERHDPERQGENPGQRRHPSRATALDFRRKATGRWSDLIGLQHPEGVDASSRVASARWLLTRLVLSSLFVFGFFSLFFGRSDGFFFLLWLVLGFCWSLGTTPTSARVAERAKRLWCCVLLVFRTLESLAK